MKRIFMTNIIKSYIMAAILLLLTAVPTSAQIIKENNCFINITATEFMERFLDNTLEEPEYKTPEKKTVIHLYANWAGPCRSFHPKLEQYAKSHPDYDYYALDVSHYNDIPESERSLREWLFNYFRGVPTVLLGRPDGSWSYFRGDVDEPELTKILNDFFSR